jgi:Fe-S cluster assembly protein SufD
LKDRSSGVFNGRAIVHEGAEKTDSSQSNKNLLLSQDAIMNSNPQLEIYTDDVKCSHGSTTGALEEDALFYIQSRGLDEASARELLVRGFASEIIDLISNDEIRDHVIDHFDQWINGNNQ